MVIVELGGADTIVEAKADHTHYLQIRHEEGPLPSYEDVFRVTADLIKGNKNRLVHLIKKRPTLFRYGEQLNSYDYLSDGAYAYLEIWKRLKDCGIPVIDNLYIASGTEVYMPDLTASGGSVFGKMEAENFGFIDRGNRNAVACFSKLPLAEISDEAIRIFAMASKQGVALNYDDPLILHINYEGSWRLLALDIGGTVFGRDPSEAHKMNCVNLDFFMRNIVNLKKFFEFLSLKNV